MKMRTLKVQDCSLALMAQLDAHLTGDQEVAGLTCIGLATFFRGD